MNRPPVQGRHDAVGFVVEPALLGETEARRRVLAHWQPGSRLALLPDGAWLLLLAAPVSVRAERAPGLLVVAAVEGSTAGSTGGSTAVSTGGRWVRLWRGGLVLDLDAEQLPVVDLADWVDVDELSVQVLQPVEGAEPAPAAIPPPAFALTTLRDAAGVSTGSGGAGSAGWFGRVGGGLVGRGWVGRGWVGRVGGRRALAVSAGIAVVAVVVVATVVAVHGSGAGSTPTARPSSSQPTTGSEFSRQALPPIGETPAPQTAPPAPQTTDAPGRLPWPSLVLPLVLLVSWLRRQGSTPSGRGAGGARSARGSLRQARAGLMSRLVAGPFGFAFRHRHERYLYRLTKAFEAADYDEALRRAIALGGAGRRGALSVRLPRPRLGALAPSYSGPGSGRGVATSLSMSAYLHELYRQAAEALEKDDQVERAAFVRADLLGAPVDAVLLLDRHGRHRLAAALAEGRRLDPALVVRLWWLAGDRDRAVDNARLRGGLDEAARRLHDVDPQAALRLRSEWVTSLLDAGDVHAAVEAAWPTPQLRALVEPHLAAGIAAGGPGGARLLAHLVCGGPTPAGLGAAEALLASADEALAPAQAAFVTTMAGLDCDDPATERRLASLGLRRVLTRPQLLRGLGSNEIARTTSRLRARAGRVHAADAPPVPGSRPRATRRCRSRA